MVKKMMRTRSRKIQLQRGSQRKNGVSLGRSKNYHGSFDELLGRWLRR
jgi:hypothetical protein